MRKGHDGQIGWFLLIRKKVFGHLKSVFESEITVTICFLLWSFRYQLWWYLKLQGRKTSKRHCLGGWESTELPEKTSMYEAEQFFSLLFWCICCERASACLMFLEICITLTKRKLARLSVFRVFHLLQNCCCRHFTRPLLLFITAAKPSICAEKKNQLHLYAAAIANQAVMYQRIW